MDLHAISSRLADHIADCRQGSPHRPLVGGIFDDIWDGIKDAAESAYEAAKKIAIEVADTVRVAITTLVDGIETTIHKALATVEDALEAIGGFFNQILVAIEKVIAFLRALFDWGEIIRTHNVLHDVFRAGVEITTTHLRDARRFTGALAAVAAAPKPPVTGGGPSLNPTRSALPGAANGLYESITLLRMASNLSGVVLHGVAVFQYGG